MGDGEWNAVCKDAEVTEGSALLVTSGSDPVLVTRLGGKVFAVGNKCPHYECKLHEGLLLGGTVVCRCHDARFDIVTGKVLSPPALKDLPVYPVRIEKGEVLLGPAVKPRIPRPEGSDGRTFLIVGAGAAGNAAAETLRREGFAGRIVMVSPERDLPYDRPNLSKDFMSGEAKPEWMPLRSTKFYADQGIEFLLGVAVRSLDTVRKTVTLSDGRSLTWDKALLATGGAPRRPAIPGADGEGCYLLRSFDDGRAILEAAAVAKRAALVGAGFIGMELASALRQRGLEVTVVAPEKVPLARILGDRVGTYMKRRHEEKGVVFQLGAVIQGISGPRGAKVITLAGGGSVEADFVVLGVGITPILDYIEGSGLTQEGAVPVTETLQTRKADIYAAGDIASLPGTDRQGMRRVEHWVEAERQGQHAARAMLGSSAAYDEVPFFWTRQTGVSLKYVGYARRWDEIAYRGEVETGAFLAGYYDGGRLVAAAGMGMPNDITAIEILLRRGAPPSAGVLSNPGVDLAALARQAEGPARAQDRTEGTARTAAR